MKQMIIAFIACVFCASAFAADASMPMAGMKMDSSQAKMHKAKKMHKHHKKAMMPAGASAAK